MKVLPKGASQMRLSGAVLMVAGLSACETVQDALPITPLLTLEPHTFVASDGTEVEAEKGHFAVPENRSDPESRMIEIGFVRFKSTSPNPGSPIVYLAGGPGGTGVGTAQGRRFPLFMAMREFGDVIAFDQRGTGLSNDIEPCDSGLSYPLDEPMVRDKLATLYLEAAAYCGEKWRDAGIDLSGYNTAESARDIADLRRAIGAEKISLWGISYGSHLAFATLKETDHIDRVVLTAIEGLEATVKLPERTDAFFDRLQASINKDEDARAAYPDIAALMRKVHGELEINPVAVTIKGGASPDVEFMIGKTDMQLLSSFSISDPFRSRRLPAMYAAADAGEYDSIAPTIYRFLRKDPIRMRGMPEAMDIMSGISEDRLAQVEKQAGSSLLGDMLNFPMPHMIGAFELAPLGDDFRRAAKTKARTLVLISTLDGRTYPGGADYALKGFSNLTRVTVHNGGHNVFMADPVITEIIAKFMRGQEVPEEVTLDAPKFVY